MGNALLGMKGQVGIEYMIMLGFLFLVLTPLVFYSVDTMRLESSTHQARRAADILAETIDSVGAQGFPARATVDLVLPEGVAAGSYVDNSTVVIKLTVPGGTRDIVATHDRCADGVLPEESGLYRITVRARPDGCVDLSMELILVDPSRFDITLSAGQDTNRTITFFNLVGDTTVNLTASGAVQSYIDLNMSTPAKESFVEFGLPEGTSELMFEIGPAPVGTYTGVITIQAPGGFAYAIPVTLTVTTGVAENWYRRGIDLKEFAGKGRVNEPVEVWVNFAESGNPALYMNENYNSIRIWNGITDVNYSVQVWNISRVNPVFINSATLTFLANVSANDQDSTYEYYVYYYDKDRGGVNYTTDLLYEYDTIQNSYYFVSQTSSGLLSEVRNKLSDGQNDVGNTDWGFFQYRTTDTWNNEPTSGTKTVTCGPVFCEVYAYTGPWSEVQSAWHKFRFYSYLPEIHSWNNWTMGSTEGMQTLNFFVAKNHDWRAFTPLKNDTIVNATLDESGGGAEGWADGLTNSKGSRWDSWIGLDALSLDNGLPVTGSMTMIPASSAGWRYTELTGCGEHCDPRNAECTAPSGWTSISFDDLGWTYSSTPDSGWGGSGRNRLYRRKFTISASQLPEINTLRVWARSRQGIECWVNEVSIGHDGTCRLFNPRNNLWTRTDTSMLVVGDNVLACRVAEILLPDGYFDASLEFNPPTYEDNFGIATRYLKNKTSSQNLTIHGFYNDGGSAQQLVGWENKYVGNEINITDLVQWSTNGWKSNQTSDCGDSCDPRVMTCPAPSGWNTTSFDDTSWNSTSTPDANWGCDNCTRFYRKQFNVTSEQLVNAKNFTLYVRNQEGAECFINGMSVGYDPDCHTDTYYSNTWPSTNISMLHSGSNLLACQVKEDADTGGDEYFDAKLELVETFPGFDYSPGAGYEIAIDMLLAQNQTCCGYVQDFYARRTHPLAVSLGPEETV